MSILGAKRSALSPNDLPVPVDPFVRPPRGPIRLPPVVFVPPAVPGAGASAPPTGAPHAGAPTPLGAAALSLALWTAPAWLALAWRLSR